MKVEDKKRSDLKRAGAVLNNVASAIRVSKEDELKRLLQVANIERDASWAAFDTSWDEKEELRKVRPYLIPLDGTTREEHL